MFNTVNYNVSLARAWVAIAEQQRHFLHRDLQDELKRLQKDVLNGVLEHIRDLVRRRKRALAVRFVILAGQFGKVLSRCQQFVHPCC